MKEEKFCPSVEQYMLMWNPGSSLHRTAIAARESNYFPSKFFKTLFEKFCSSVPWDPPVRHLLVILVFLDFRVEPGFQGRFLTVESGSSFSGHPVGGKLTLIMLHQTPLMRTTLVQFLGLRTDFRVLGRFQTVGPKSSIIGPPETFT